MHYDEHPANSQDCGYVEQEESQLIKGQEKEDLEIGVEFLKKEAEKLPV